MNARENRSFAARNRILTVKQQYDFYNKYQKFGLNTDTNWDVNTLFSNNLPLILEIGFGTGDSLINDATTNQQHNYIGIEIYRAGILRVIREADSSNLANLKVCMGDAVKILQNCIADNALAGVQIYFPDPWPKKRHHKRRLISQDFVTLLCTKLKNNGFIHLATDWQNYAEQMLDVLTAQKQLKNSAGNLCYAKNSNRALTKFEARGIKLGHHIYDLQFSLD